jgi:hypothetical protein
MRVLRIIRGAFLVACLGAGAFLGAQGTAPSAPDHEKLLAALAAADFSSVYFEDGASDGSVTDRVRVHALTSSSDPENAVQAVLDLKDAGIPLLIAHLDDARPTRALFKGNPVPLGHIAMDILTHVIGANRSVLDLENTDDGLGAGIQPDYYFRPDASLAEMKRTKQNWRRLYRRGRIAFVLPDGWK